LQFLFVFSAVDHSPVSLGDYVYPRWADSLGWLMFAITVAMIPLAAVIQTLKIYADDRSLSPTVRHAQLP